MSKFNKLSRAEMRNVTGGDFATCTYQCPGPGGQLLVIPFQPCTYCFTSPSYGCPSGYTTGATCDYDRNLPD
ncbi:hypothetical protein [Mucilaginibacter sp. OK098]|jgi:natural product precursor|uniref:hypothetical protein n=1 Tax=Mucilaginibacter sp. OK098 TaxID=1855297 RepID=UPI00093475AE